MGYNALPVYPGEVPPVCVCVGGGGYSWGIMPYLYTLGRFLLCVCVGGGVFMGYNALPVYPGEVPPVCACGGGGGGGIHGV